ncbi:MAG: N-acetyl-gamma-glutamyl-phosphate reductase [Actinobacteria bacterium]|nr:N-acetyl-gamma-glutamyl-phosphate reductase [Actinomycetota bacterium]|tara:strand:- start:7461 stop:8468 length:1008 start_codon:yes stop_codon:yes gene_type:complete
MLKVAILGASGFTGFECVRLLQFHPDVTITHLFALRESDTDIHRYLGESNSIPKTCDVFEPTQSYEIDCLIIALPHTHVHPIMADIIKQSYKIIDLSADFRLQSEQRYKTHYQNDHSCKDILNNAVYGLNEFYSDKIKTSQLVANPGCYAIATILSLKPLTDQNLIKHAVIDAKSGVSGAGKALKENFLYANANEHLSAYQTNQHRHMAEFEENCPCPMIFSPHLVPMNRGILVSSYIELNNKQTIDSIAKCYQSAYEYAPCVSISIQKTLPSTQDVVGSNMANITINQVSDNHAIIITVIDNLIKGAGGNAIQSMNLMFGLSETAGLPLVAQRV